MVVQHSARFVAERAEHVRIVNENIKQVAEELTQAMKSARYTPADIAELWSSNPLHPTVRDLPEDTAAQWIFVLDTLNFCFWVDADKFRVTYQGKTHSGYWTLCACLKRAIDSDIPILDASFLATLTIEQASQIFAGDDGVMMPLLGERVRCLHEAGTGLLNSFNGLFANAIRESCHSIKTLIFDKVLPTFSSFRDVSVYQSEPVAFYKRVQILCADLWGCFGGKSLGDFHDIDSLTMFADYRVPQQLVGLGVLSYSPHLLQLLQSEVVLESGCQEECEIRGCSIHVVELIKKEMHTLGFTEATSALIDFCLWDTAKIRSSDLSGIPIHRVISVYY
eukprot:c14714_g1_i2.p1 GENE.c14714_g1_i2~~c14714_g1_i2.p1  ORF type:complete len:346 (+),score=58.11 c14714_g1_i2:32-1039(+)